MNHGKPIFQDKAVREALYAAMDKENIINTVYYGIHGPSESYLPPQSWAFNPDLEPHAYDVARANQILDEAGWIAGQTASGRRTAPN